MNHGDSHVRDKKANKLQLTGVHFGLLAFPCKENTDSGKWVVREEFLQKNMLWPTRQRSFHSYFMKRLTAVRAYQRLEAKTQIRQRK